MISFNDKLFYIKIVTLVKVQKLHLKICHFFIYLSIYLIMNTSSGAGVIGFKESAAYVAAKHGVVGLTKAATLDYAQSNIRINAVAPGIIDTPMIQRFSGCTPEGHQAMISQEPAGRLGQPEEIAAAVLWLCSDAASFVIEHTMVVDGGQTVGIQKTN
jgi:NAD(P)-dependent dehydrogenase (short-subunit alcohol dehydrogenase family)